MIEQRKPWYQSKTKIGSLIAAMALAVGQQLPEYKALCDLVAYMAGALTMWGARDAVQK